jgi:hypothetical protein
MICPWSVGAATGDRLTTDIESFDVNPFLKFLNENKIWWITPIVIVLGLVGWLILTGESDGPSGADPFIYDAH